MRFPALLPECTSTFTREAFPTGTPYINDVRKLPQLFCPMQLRTVPVICLHNTGFNCINCYSYYGGNIIRVCMYMLDFQFKFHSSHSHQGFASFCIIWLAKNHEFTMENAFLPTATHVDALSSNTFPKRNNMYASNRCAFQRLQ